MKPLTAKAYYRRASSDCGTSGITKSEDVQLLPFQEVLKFKV